jgi:phospholipase A-2-activating protein
MAEFSTKDVCRALAKIPEGHNSGGQLLSASNDGVICVWTLKGHLTSELHGHENFVYSLAVLPDGKFVSSGEDRTVRIWQDTTCIQTIILPAVSVWSVAVCHNGDIIAGSSDKLARIFTTDSDRLADAATEAEFDKAIKSSSIPLQTVGAINKTDMEGPDFLQRRSGKKDGQIQMIKENDGSVSAYSWSTTKRSWEMVGTVVDGVGAGQKVTYNGREYDYVFDVDIEEGKPALKLPYNVTQNPHEVAMKWLQDHELPMTYLEETANFIIKGTEGAALGPSSPPPRGPDPLGTENRYRPDSTSTFPPIKPPMTLPHKEYVSIVAGKTDASYKEILKLNDRFSESTEPDKASLALSRKELDALMKISVQLQGQKFDGVTTIPNSPALEACVRIALKIATQWRPTNNRLAGLDLLRFLAAVSPELPAIELDQEKDILTVVFESGVFDSSLVATNTKLAMLTIRLLANLMSCSKGGRNLVEAHFDSILEKIKSIKPYCPNDPPLSIAVTTYYLNLAVWLIGPENSEMAEREERSLTVFEETCQILRSLPAVDAKATDKNLPQITEPSYRGLFAVGTLLLGLGTPEVKDAAKTIFNIGALISQLRQRGYFKEPRFQRVVEGLEHILA